MTLFPFSPAAMKDPSPQDTRSFSEISQAEYWFIKENLAAAKDDDTRKSLLLAVEEWITAFKDSAHADDVLLARAELYSGLGDNKNAVITLMKHRQAYPDSLLKEVVKEKLSEYASTADEYRKYIKDTKYKSNLLTFIQKYVTDNTVLNSKPSAYLKQLKANYKNDEMATCDQMNQLYLTYTGAAAYASFEEYISKSYNMTMEEYDESIEDKVTDGLKFALFCQYFAETEGISATVDDARAEYIKNGGKEENFENVLNNYGKGYIVQDALFTKVLEKISESVTVK